MDIMDVRTYKDGKNDKMYKWTNDECCGKIDLLGFKTGLYISFYGGNAVRHIKQRGYFQKRCLNFWLF